MGKSPKNEIFQKVIEIKLTSEEQKELVVSASHVKELCNFIDESGLI